MNPPPVPPHSDLSGIGHHHHHHHHNRLPSTPERTQSHQQNFVKTPSRRDLPPIPSNQKPFQLQTNNSIDLDMKEEIRQRELEEVRARVAQMEKTMRWWSDCTANWREKWSKVRNERNQSREECRALKFKLESVIKENANLKKLQQKFEYKLKRLSDQEAGLETKALQGDIFNNKFELNINELNLNESHTNNKKNNNDDDEDDDVIISKSCKPPECKQTSISTTTTTTTSSSTAPVLKNENSDDFWLKMIEDLKEKLEKETREKLKVMDTVNGLQGQVDKLTEQYDDLRRAKADCDEEISRLRQWKDERMETIRSDLEDGMMSDTNSEFNSKLTDLHRELEKLQVENATEWTLREKLETEKISLERENKKLVNELSHVTEELNRCRLLTSGHSSTNQNAALDMEELSEKTKELSELKHAHARLKKQLQDRSSELEHVRSRAEHYEMEVKKLRGRIEELKRDLANAEDENDQQSMAMKKMQRNMEELQQQIDNYNLQLQHLQSRLRRSRTSLAGSDDGDDNHSEKALV
ncbi:hypothetical protein HELRODRAFT_188774 [Helobdella robusta]|uniref:Myosin tail domain-containing protein n=1 Tax=Helobdella robusta TaxID=6412 RepID=T1FQC4_HELRO|nr:hypothetical protein HELRODRAFT_188774 [Helobdella robusta]ESO02610.1 hypothetical protein HELRODRAFT_188774 [Helobdella robusta]